MFRLNFNAVSSYSLVSFTSVALFISLPPPFTLCMSLFSFSHFIKTCTKGSHLLFCVHFHHRDFAMFNILKRIWVSLKYKAIIYQWWNFYQSLFSVHIFFDIFHFLFDVLSWSSILLVSLLFPSTVATGSYWQVVMGSMPLDPISGAYVLWEGPNLLRERKDHLNQLRISLTLDFIKYLLVKKFLIELFQCILICTCKGYLASRTIVSVFGFTKRRP